MKKISFIVVSFLIIILSSCKTVYLPLCERFAESKPSPSKYVGSDCYSICKEKHIKITVLDCNVALFKGRKKRIEWLKKNYVLLFCDFDQNNVNGITMDNCNVCINNVKKWMEDLKNSDLDKDSLSKFFQDKNYCNICIPHSPCTTK